MPKRDFEEDDDEDFDEDESEEDSFEDDDKEFREETRGRPKKLPVETKEEDTSKKIKKAIKSEGITYSAYRLPERVGVINDKTKESIGEDVYTILASIKNDLQELKDGLL